MGVLHNFYSRAQWHTCIKCITSLPHRTTDPRFRPPRPESTPVAPGGPSTPQDLRSGSVSCSLFGRRPTASELVFDVSSSEAAPPPHLRRLAPLAPRELTARVGPPRARAAASCLVATPPREVGPALPGRRVAPASAASLSFSARPSPPPAPPQARRAVAPLVVDHGGPAAAATGLPPVSSYVPTPLAEAELARLSPPRTVDSRSHLGPSGLGLPVRRLTRFLPTAPPPSRSPP